MNQIAFPYSIDSAGRTALTDTASHIRDLVEQTLLTSQGERVNRPTFGTGLRQMTFAPNSAEVAMAIQFLIQGALQQWLGDLVQIEQVGVQSEDATLTVQVQYVVRATQQRETAQVITGTTS
ncbi:MAG TPA: GPW/gp25 family protein [Caulobacter sp.]|nr:GPW/gp25 family protein [Caulobacter sp.]